MRNASSRRVSRLHCCTTSKLPQTSSTCICIKHHILPALSDSPQTETPFRSRKSLLYYPGRAQRHSSLNRWSRISATADSHFEHYRPPVRFVPRLKRSLREPLYWTVKSSEKSRHRLGRRVEPCANMARTLKRKAPEPRSGSLHHYWKTTPSNAGVLHDVSVPEAQNKRRKVLRCVLIPKEETMHALASISGSPTVWPHEQDILANGDLSDDSHITVDMKAGAAETHDTMLRTNSLS